MAEPIQNQEQQQQEQYPAFNAELKRNLFFAEALPGVKNGFISREQAAYCMGWKDIVNPLSEPQTILYNAMGPDILTPLLTTNAENICGVDFSPPIIDKIRRYLAAWEKVDADALSLPPDNKYFRRDLEESRDTQPTDENVQRALAKSIKLRGEIGYWDVQEMEDWSIDRCIMIELKKMGVDPKTIQVSEVDGRVQLNFPWAYPGEQPKQRTVRYIADRTYGIIDNPKDIIFLY